MAQKTHVEFALINPEMAGIFSFQGYTDQYGELQIIYDRTDENGIPQKRWFDFKTRVLRVPVKQQEVIKHLRNAPFCEGNPMGCTQVYYKEIDPERDAEILLEEEVLKTESKSIALSLSGEQLASVAIMCGENRDNQALQKVRVLKYAENNPKGFKEIVNDSELTYRALFKRAQAAGSIQRSGTTLYWNQIALGLDEDEAVKMLIKDEKVFQAISKELNPAPAKKK